VGKEEAKVRMRKQKKKRRKVGGKNREKEGKM
jgi:hypothetical protein